MQRAPLLGATLRAGQIRRANPELTDQIDAELRPAAYNRRIGSVPAAATMVTEKQAIVRNTPRKA